ncbi:hypothetical protein QFC22_003007 [Naganishia vaughanmartiniae]|uniref:Uncharacterized protein n=1 Tax=Naganishia vaughanmartiniae TaxID=1424756 RepID=A0ACC2X9M8_9TREE|nr:hypothetical protein QFC22_003007 [Naganishia vaughanmartiniae]
MLGVSALQDRAVMGVVARSEFYHKLALGNDSMGIDRNSIENDLWVNVVDVVILAFTIIGAGAILVNMFSRELRGRAATVRTRLVQGLVVSDFVLGLTAMVSSSRKLQGKPFKTGSQACDGFGLLLVAILWSEHIWTFVLAFATYMILIYPLHKLTRIIERRWRYFYIIIWSLSFGSAVLTYELYGYWASGGLCYYGSNSGLYGELMQFMPRALVFTSVCFFYARLYVFLRRPDRIKASFSGSGPKNSGAPQTDAEYTYQSATSSMIAAREARKPSACSAKEKMGSQFAKFSFKKRERDPVGEAVELDEKKSRPKNVGMGSQQLIQTRDFAGQGGSEGLPDRSRSGSDESKNSEIPPWERLELPAFQIDGQRYGGSASSAGSSKPGSGWGELKPFGKKSGGSKRPTSSGSAKSGNKLAVQNAFPRDRTRSPQVASAAGPTSSLQRLGARHQAEGSIGSGRDPSSSLFSEYEGMGPKTIITAPSPQQQMGPFPAVPDPFEEGGPTDIGHPTPRAADEIAPDQQPTPGMQRNGQLRGAPASVVALDHQSPFSSSSMRPLIDRTGLTSIEHTQLVSIRRDSAIGETDSRRGSGPVSFVLPPSHKEERSDMGSEQAYGSTTLSDSEQGFTAGSSGETLSGQRLSGTGEEGQRKADEEEDDGDDMDFAQMLAASYIGGDDEPTGSRTNRSGSDGTEFIQESTASYLNRKTAMLMLYFPLAYCLLFSVSLIRIIFDFSANGSPKPLRVIARWFVFSQGAVDAIIYGIVEVNVKRGVRKKVRKGLISPGSSRGGNGTGSANMLSGFLGKKRGASNGPQIDVVDDLRNSK